MSLGTDREALRNLVAAAIKGALEAQDQVLVHEIGEYDFEKGLIVALTVKDDGSKAEGIVAPERQRLYLRVDLDFPIGNRLDRNGKPYYAERGNSGGWE